MKKYSYLISIISYAVLAYLFISKKQYVFAIIISAACIYYLWKITKGNKNRQKSNINSSEETNDSVNKDKALSDLKEMLKVYRRNMKIFRNASITGSLMGIVIMFINVSLGIAICLFMIPLGYMFYKNYKAVHLIETGIKDK